MERAPRLPAVAAVTPDHPAGHSQNGHSHPEAYWDGVGHAWISSAPQRLWREHTDRLQFALLRRWIGIPKLEPHEPGPVVLKTDLFDEIAGRGIVGPLHRMGCRVNGVDVAPKTVAEACRRNPELHAVAADIRSLPFADGTFDVVYSGSTLDHFDAAGEIDRAIREIRRVLRPSGRLILTLDNPGNPIVRLRNGPLMGWLRRTGIVPYQVGVTLDRMALVDCLQNRGFSVEEVSGILHCPRALAVLMSRFIQRGSIRLQESFLHHLMAWERLEHQPTRFLTGYFTAVLATREG